MIRCKLTNDCTTTSFNNKKLAMKNPSNKKSSNKYTSQYKEPFNMEIARSHGTTMVILPHTSHFVSNNSEPKEMHNNKEIKSS